MNARERKAVKAKSDAFFSKVRKSSGYKAVEVEIRRMNDIGQMLAEMAEQSGKTQTEIASTMKVSQPYVSHLCRTGEISVKNLMAYADACGAQLKITVAF
jgi:predicted XRE-type DNA-binding protein